jgi:hypothetical protein
MVAERTTGRASRTLSRDQVGASVEILFRRVVASACCRARLAGTGRCVHRRGDERPGLGEQQPACASGHEQVAWLRQVGRWSRLPSAVVALGVASAVSVLLDVVPGEWATFRLAGDLGAGPRWPHRHRNWQHRLGDGVANDAMRHRPQCRGGEIHASQRPSGYSSRRFLNPPAFRQHRTAACSVWKAGSAMLASTSALTSAGSLSGASAGAAIERPSLLPHRIQVVDYARASALCPEG